MLLFALKKFLFERSHPASPSLESEIGNRGAVWLSGSRQHSWKWCLEQNKECFFVLEEEEEGWWKEGGSKENHMSKKNNFVFFTI